MSALDSSGLLDEALADVFTRRRARAICKD